MFFDFEVRCVFKDDYVKCEFMSNYYALNAIRLHHNTKFEEKKIELEPDTNIDKNKKNKRN